MNDTEKVKSHREIRKLIELRIKQVGVELYDTFDKNERTCVQFGMFPAVKIQPAEAALMQEMVAGGSAEHMEARDIGRLLAVAIMDAANAGSAKMVV